MEETWNNLDKKAGLIEATPSQSFKNWLKLIIWVAVIVSFMIYWGPWLIVKIPGYPPILKTIDEYGIDANQYYYSEVEQFSDARVELQNTMDYKPGGQAKP